MNRHRGRANAGPGQSSVDPHAAELLQVGLRHHQAGRLAEAEDCYRQVLTARPGHADALHLLGVIAFQSGQHGLAVEMIRQALQQNSQDANYFYNLGNALHHQGKLDEAVAAFRQAIGIEPDHAQAHSNLGNVLRNQGKLDEAVAAFRQAIRIKPAYAEMHFNLGAALRDQGKLEEAVAACHQAIALNPNFDKVYANLGLALIELGRLSEGRAALEDAVQLAPRNTAYRRYLGDLVHFATGDLNLKAIEQLSQESASLPVGDRIELCFALAKAYEDVGRHAEAFHQWLDGNTLKRQQIAYDEAATLGKLNRVREVFTRELIQKWQNVGNPSPVPVFIFGMLRSGSTLIEQILASHPQVFGGGELNHLDETVKETRTAFGREEDFPELMLSMTEQDFGGLSARYLSKIEPLAPAAVHITDKMPGNFLFAGLIHLVLPNAIMIHTIRDPIDTCLSCFSKLFAGEQNHTYDLAELGRYHRHYQALMAHWHGVLPAGRILNVHYEEVVADLEGQARRIIAHCGLDWDPRCLAFHETERPVRTVSATQVRQPLYNSAIGRWRVYEPFLGPLLSELAG